MTNTESSAPTSAPSGSAGDGPGRGPAITADDLAAWSGQVVDQARRVLASGGPDPESAAAIERALIQVEADRANGESAQESTMHLQQALDRDELHRG